MKLSVPVPWSVSMRLSDGAVTEKGCPIRLRPLVLFEMERPNVGRLEKSDRELKTKYFPGENR